MTRGYEKGGDPETAAWLGLCTYAAVRPRIQDRQRA